MSGWNNNGEVPYYPYGTLPNGQLYPGTSTYPHPNHQTEVVNSQVGYPGYTQNMYGGQSAGPNVAPQLQTQPNTYPRPQNVASHSSRMPAQARTTDYVSSSTTPTLASHRAGANSYGRSSREAQTGQSRSSATNDTSGTKAHTNNGNVAPSSGSAYVEIGKALYNAETNEYRFRCHLEDCTEKTIRRIQDLKRHYEDFHGGVKYECLSEGCGKNFARKDKFRKHCREAHGEYTEYPFQEHAAENPGFCTGVG